MYKLTFKLANTKIEPKLTGNGKCSVWEKAKLTKANKATGLYKTIEVLDGEPGHDMLTNFGEHKWVDVLPIKLICLRVYSGKAQEFDDDNIRMGFKAYRDGICIALGIDDDPDHLTGFYPQERGKENYLEFEVIPAWAWEKEAVTDDDSTTSGS